MTSSENGWRLFPEIERTVFAAYQWPGADAPIVRIRLDPNARLALVGKYSVEGVPFEITERGTKMFVRPPFGEPAELVPTAPDNLVKLDDGTAFQITANGLEAHQPNEPPKLVDKATTEHPLFLLEAGKFDEAVAAFKAAKDTKREEERMNGLGYSLLGKDSKKAIEVFRLNAAAFTDSANTHDSLADAYAQTGNKASAIASYEKALAVLPNDPRIPAAAKPAFKTRVEAELVKLRAR
jgi:tetratricopeptide (TPR) repeat protein